MFVNLFAQRDVRDVMARLTADMDVVVGHAAPSAASCAWSRNG
jgi:hypothetical protein